MSDYETDFALWSERQAELLRRVSAGEQVNDLVDWQNVAEEIESLGNRDRREVFSPIAIILEHLIKLTASPSEGPKPGWRSTVVRERAELELLLRDGPSLRRHVAPAIADRLAASRELAAPSLEAYREAPIVVVGSLTFSEEQVIGRWFPGEPGPL